MIPNHWKKVSLPWALNICLLNNALWWLWLCSNIQGKASICEQYNVTLSTRRKEWHFFTQLNQNIIFISAGNKCKKTNIFKSLIRRIFQFTFKKSCCGLAARFCNYLYLNFSIICCYVYCLFMNTFFAQNSTASVRKYKIHLQISCFKHTFAITDEVHRTCPKCNITIHTRITLQTITTHRNFGLRHRDSMGGLDFWVVGISLSQSFHFHI